MSDHEFHPIADLFPLIEGEEFDALCADVKKNGLRQNIILFEGKILDGRNRYRACKAVDEELSTIQFLGTDPYEYVTAQNLLRRHISPTQRALIAAQMANMRHGGDRKSEQPKNQVANLQLDISRTEAAKKLNVSPRSVDNAIQVLSKGTPELVAAVRSDTVSISAAAVVATLRKEEQVKVVAKGPKAVTEAAKEVRESMKAESLNAEVWKLSSGGRVPSDRTSILLRHWQLCTPFQRKRFIEQAEPPVYQELRRLESDEY